MLFPGVDLTNMRIATVINTLSSVEKRANTHPLLYAHRYPVQFCFCFRRSLSDASLPLSLLLVYQYPRLKTTRSISTRLITTEVIYRTWATFSLFRVSSAKIRFNVSRSNVYWKVKKSLKECSSNCRDFFQILFGEILCSMKFSLVSSLSIIIYCQ